MLAWKEGDDLLVTPTPESIGGPPGTNMGNFPRNFPPGEKWPAGMEVPDSQTNFVLVARRGYSAEALCNYLRSNGVLVRYFNHALLSRYIRISIGTDEEMATVLQLLQELEDKEDE